MSGQPQAEEVSVDVTHELPPATSGRWRGGSSGGGEDPVDDAALITDYLDGNLAAYGELARRYQIPLFRLLLGLLADEDLAEQACEEVFIVANRRLDQLDEPSRFYRWLLAIAREVSRDILDSRADVEATLPPEQQAPREQIKHEVHAALQQLDPDLRLALVLVEFRRASPDEVAAALGANKVFSETTLPGGTYQGVDSNLTVIGVPNVLVASSEMPDDLAYAITKAMFENIGDLQAVHPAAKQTTVDFTLSATPIPLHPGAIRYYEETGATVPEKLHP